MDAGVLPGSGGPTLKWGFRKTEHSLMSVEERQNPPGFVPGRKKGKHVEDEEIPQGQCFFVNYYKVKKRLWGGLKVFGAAEPRDLSGENAKNEDRAINTSELSTLHTGEELELVAGPHKEKVCKHIM